jgi:hypothetical protein
MAEPRLIAQAISKVFQRRIVLNFHALFPILDLQGRYKGIISTAEDRKKGMIKPFLALLLVL